jgi:hypothetical protein
LNRTAVAPRRFEPVIVTGVPTGPEVGLKEAMLGAQSPATPGKTKLAILTPGGATPVVTWMGPVAPAATRAVTWVDETGVKVAAPVPPKSTAVAPVRFVPLIVTQQPVGPDGGEKETTVGEQPPGAATTKKGTATDGPSAFATTTGALAGVPPGTIASIRESDTTVYDAAFTPPNCTPVTVGVWKLDPVMVIPHPMGPEAGDTVVTTGIASGAIAIPGAASPTRIKAVTAPMAATRPPMCCLYDFIVQPSLSSRVLDDPDRIVSGHGTPHTPGAHTHPTPFLGSPVRP